MVPERAQVPVDELSAVIFDVDGVVTDTASVHAAAWKRVFDDVLRSRTSPTGAPLRPFDPGRDYLEFVDGRSRADGVRTFLASRGVTVPETASPGSSDTATVASVAARKDRYFRDHIQRHPVHAYPSTVALLRRLRDAGIATAAVSASRNCAAVLHAADVDGWFDARVDGVDAARLHFPGKPDPALFLEAARRLAVAPERTAMVEDSLVGVEAGRRGGFGQVIGVDRTGQRGELYSRGADIVVGDLAELDIVRAAP
ncbi:hydrolase [Nocardiopsis gilva YIM 90087]|uniref:Hydrolase n=1 Tax=Nocardiopsis gilva YIM 90087 TaxID=1235441 RepID=A0A223S6Y4_9ACTN|nr:HAD-IA family hydrolase [Nocardiopsis gilva]ASU83884.1 hydrolase [Nocardiopsis gilva YIM 90087]